MNAPVLAMMPTMSKIPVVDLIDPAIEPSDEDLDALMEDMMAGVRQRALKRGVDLAKLVAKDTEEAIKTLS